MAGKGTTLCPPRGLCLGLPADRCLSGGKRRKYALQFFQAFDRVEAGISGSSDPGRRQAPDIADPLCGRTSGMHYAFGRGCGREWHFDAVYAGEAVDPVPLIFQRFAW